MVHDFQEQCSQVIANADELGSDWAAPFLALERIYGGQDPSYEVEVTVWFMASIINVDNFFEGCLRPLVNAVEDHTPLLDQTMERYARMIVVTILSPLLSRMLNVWATSLFTEVLALDTQIYLRELLGLEKLYWIFASLVLSFILFDRA